MGVDDDSAGQKKKIVVIGVSSVLLVAAVVGTVTYGVTRQPEGSQGEGSSEGGIETSSKAAQTLCQYTDYKKSCEKSLAGANDDSDPKDLIKMGFKAASRSIGDVIKNSSLIQQAVKDPMVTQALDVCKEVLGTSIDDLNRSFDKIGAFDASDLDGYIADLKTWLSGAITNQETCIEAFENTTGDTGEKMKNLLNHTRELSSNGLAMVDELSQMLETFEIPGITSRRLLLTNEEKTSKMHTSPTDDDVPDFVRFKRSLLQENPTTLKPNAIVSQDGKGQFMTIMEAVNSIPKTNNQTFVILVMAGVYNEFVDIQKGINNVVLLGEGPSKTRISGNKNVAEGITTFRTATVVITGEGFIAKDIGIENSAGADKHQAVALRVSGDKTILYNCHIDGYQDTLYTHTYRQYYRDCVITGTIDFVFGDALAVFQNCEMVVRKPLDNQFCMVTAQGREDPRGEGAIVLQNCTITAESGFVPTPKQKAYLGRPWKQYSRTLVMQSFIDNVIAPEGWAPWEGTYGLDTCYYGEYQNRGPGSGLEKRVKWKGIQDITPEIALSLTPGTYLQASQWIKPTGLVYDSGMMKV